MQDDDKKDVVDDKDGKDDEEDIEEDEDRVAKYYITTNPKYKNRKLPQFIKIKDPVPGEVTLWSKRSFPRAARMHKKQKDNDPHRFFLSELMLYTGWTNELELGCNDEAKCRALYLEKQDAIQYVKKYTMPFAPGVEEARHYVQQAIGNESNKTGNVGDELDPE